MFWAQVILTLTLTWFKNKEIPKGVVGSSVVSHINARKQMSNKIHFKMLLFIFVIHHHHWQDSWILGYITYPWTAETLKTQCKILPHASHFLSQFTLCILCIFLPLCRGDSCCYSSYLYLESSYVEHWLNVWGLSPRVYNCLSNAS